MIQPALFSWHQRLDDLSKGGDPLEALKLHINFEVFRPFLTQYLKRDTPFSQGGRPPYDALLMFKILIVQNLYHLSDDQTEFQIKDRLSFMRFLELDWAHPVPDAKTIWVYRERLKDHIQDLFKQFDTLLKERGYLAMSGQIVDASIIKAPRQRLTEEEKAQIKIGKQAKDIWLNAAKARQKDVDARWRVKQSKPKKDHHVPLSVPEFGYKNHITIDRRYGFVRHFSVTSAAYYEGNELSSLLAENTCARVWGDTAYASQENLAYLAKKGFISHLHKKKPKGKFLNTRCLRTNNLRSKIRALVEHVFAHQKHHRKLFIRTIGLNRAKWTIGLANLVYNFKRIIFYENKLLSAG